MDQYGAINDVFYFHFAANTTAGAAGDGATPVCHVRLCGALASAAPVYNPTPDLLTHATYLDGSHEVAITASAANGFAAGSSYAVFASLTISSITPGGFLGRIHLKPCIANVTQLVGVAQSAADLKDFADTGYDPSTHKVVGVVTTDACTTNTDMRGTDSAALANVTALEATLTAMKGATFSGTTDSLEAIRDRGDAAWDTATGFSTHSAADVKAAIEAAGSHLTLIKAKTDGLNFTGTDVKATLDGEEVTPTAASKTGYAIGTGGIAAAAFAAGAIDNAAIAADAIGAVELAADAVEKAADAWSGRNIAGGSNGGRTNKDALRVLRNKRSITGGTLTVTAEDDTTAAWTAAVTTAAGNPVDSIDPA